MRSVDELDDEAMRLGMDPQLLRFLDTNSHRERIEILQLMREHITQSQLTTMALAMDLEIPTGTLDEQCDSLMSALSMLDKYEQKRRTDR